MQWVNVNFASYASIVGWEVLQLYFKPNGLMNRQKKTYYEFTNICLRLFFSPGEGALLVVQSPGWTHRGGGSPRQSNWGGVASVSGPTPGGSPAIQPLPHLLGLWNNIIIRSKLIAGGVLCKEVLTIITERKQTKSYSLYYTLSRISRYLQGVPQKITSCLESHSKQGVLFCGTPCTCIASK